MTPIFRGGAAALLLAFTGPAAAAETLRIYTWSDYFGPTTLDAFTSATGVPTSVDFFDGNEMLETKLLTGGSGYDVVFPAASNAEREAKAGALATIDTARLKNYGNLDPRITATLDGLPGWRQIGVPYTWGTIGIAYDVAAVEERLGTRRLDSLAAFFDPQVAAKLKDCGMAMLDSPLEMVAIALNYAGADPYGDSPENLAEAEKLLATAAPNLRYFSNVKALADLASGDLCVALVYSGDAAMARLRAEEAGREVEIGYAIPKEGTMMWVDLMAIPADAPNPDLAYAFIDHLLDPAVIAEVSSTVGYANANAEATALVDPALTGDPDLYPDDATMARLFPDRSIEGPGLKARTRLWTRVKSGN